MINGGHIPGNSSQGGGGGGNSVGALAGVAVGVYLCADYVESTSDGVAKARVAASDEHRFVVEVVSQPLNGARKVSD